MKKVQLQRITCKKHPGAVFYKIKGTNTFVCKFYPGQEKAARFFERAVKAAYEWRPKENRIYEPKS